MKPPRHGVLERATRVPTGRVRGRTGVREQRPARRLPFAIQWRTSVSRMGTPYSGRHRMPSRCAGCSHARSTECPGGQATRSPCRARWANIRCALHASHAGRRRSDWFKVKRATSSAPRSVTRRVAMIACKFHWTAETRRSRDPSVTFASGFRAAQSSVNCPTWTLVAAVPRTVRRISVISGFMQSQGVECYARRVRTPGLRSSASIRRS